MITAHEAFDRAERMNQMTEMMNAALDSIERRIRSAADNGIYETSYETTLSETPVEMLEARLADLGYETTVRSDILYINWEDPDAVLIT